MSKVLYSKYDHVGWKFGSSIMFGKNEITYNYSLRFLEIFGYNVAFNLFLCWFLAQYK
jgi:hypothetical protein